MEGFEKTAANRILNVESEPSFMTEKRFLSEIDRLQTQAKELADSWMTRYEDVSDDNLPDFLKQFETFLKKREDALFSMEIPEGLDPELVAEIKQFDRDVVLSFGNNTLFQGNGATAEVYEVAGHPHLCWKFVTNQANYNENNHIRDEFNLLNRMRGFEVGQIRTPTPYFLRIHPRDGHSYGMERVDGRDLSQILERPDESAEFIALAKQMNRDVIAQELTTFIEKMHKEKGITHGDLFRRNIMMDRTGHLFVIDFGKAKLHETDTHRRDMLEDLDLSTANSEIRGFFAQIDKINI